VRGGLGRVVVIHPNSVSCCVLVIGEDFVDYAPGFSRFRGVCVLVVGERDQGFPQCPTATSRPGLVV